MAATNAYSIATRDKGKVIEHTGKSVEGRSGSRGKLRTANEHFEHFNTSTTIPAGTILTSEGTTTAAATYGIGLGGEATITSDDVAAKTEALHHAGLLWQANRQPSGVPLVFECKVKTGATITASEYFVGLTDALTDTDPIALSATSTFTTSVPTDGVYMGFSATPSSGAAYLAAGNPHLAISISTDTNSIVAAGTTAFAAATYYTYRIEVDTAGNAAYYVDGAYLGSKAVALNPAVPLTPIMWAAPRASVSAAITVDYYYVGGV